MLFNHRVVVATTLLSLCISQKCLQSPPELELSTEIAEDGRIFYHGILTYDAKRFTVEDNGYPTSFTTRVHNGMLPSPTIRVKQDSMYKITLINNLEANDLNDPGEMNTFHFPNTTNIHTHGLHISPETPEDDIFAPVDPGQTHNYTYYIPCNQVGGTNWYHPHYHGMLIL